MEELAPLTFEADKRLKKPAEFERAYKRKRSVSDARLIVYACENDLGRPRLGVSVSKKVGNAVERNRVKRLFREAFRLNQHALPPVDLVLIPRLPAEATLAEYAESLLSLAPQAARRLERR